jgi:hypothetical protein
MVGEAAGHPGTTEGDRTMNARNERTKDEGRTWGEVNSSELQGITGGRGYGYNCSDPSDHLVVSGGIKTWLQLLLPEPQRHAPPPKG